MIINALAAQIFHRFRIEYLPREAAHQTRGPAGANRLTLCVRPIRPEDRPLLADIFARLRPASRRSRFLYAKTTLTEKELLYLTDVDHRNHAALIAITRLGGEPVGVARFIRDRSDPTSADVAITVVDEWQGRGVGSLLAARLKVRALREGITHITPMTAAGNDRARRLLAKVGEVSVVARDGADVSYRVTLASPVPLPPA